MGVKGFLSFLKENDYFEEFDFYNTKVIIDGSNIFRFIPYDFNIPVYYGGENNEIFNAVHKFFSILLECNVEPYVVFDGITMIEDRKRKINIREVQIKSPNLDLIEHKHLRSVLLLDVVIEVLKKLEIKFVFCNYNSDIHIVSLANNLKCPVFSNHSDFYFYNLEAGVIYFKSLNLQTISSYNGTKLIRLNIFNFKSLMTQYNFPTIEYVQLFSILNGNSELLENDVKNIVKQFKNQKGLVDFNKFLQFVSLNFEKFEKKHKLLSKFRIPSSYLIDFFKESENNKFNCIREKEKIENLNSQESSELLQRCINSGFIRAQISESFYSGVLFKILINDENSKISAYFCSQKIRQYIYSILATNNDSFKEFFIQEKTMIENNMKNLKYIFEDLPTFEEAFCSNGKDRLKFYMKIFEEEDKWILNFKKEDYFLLSVLIQWIRGSDPKISYKHILSAIIVFFTPSALYKISGCHEDQDVQSFISSKFSNSNNSKYCDFSSMNSFAQLETCFQALLDLNSILNNPLKPPSINLFNSTSFHFVYYKLKIENGFLWDFLARCFPYYPESYIDHINKILKNLKERKILKQKPYSKDL